MDSQALRVLLVDADQDSCEALAECLRERGPFIVETAASSTQAWDRIVRSDKPYQLALIDELLPEAPGEMPRRLGIGLMQRIKTYDPQIEVILFRAPGMEPILETALQAGAFRYLDKSLDRSVLLVLIRQAAEHQKLQGAVREKQHILERLLATSSDLLGAQSEQEVLHSILQGVQALNFDRVRLYILSHDGQYMHGKDHIGMDDNFLTVVRSVADDKYMHDLLDNPRPHVCRREQGESVPLEKELHKDGVNEWVCLPLLQQGRVIGALSADNKHSKRPIIEEELGPVALFTSQAAVAIANTRLFEETKRQAEQLETLRRTTLAITSPSRHTSQTIVEHAVPLLKAKGGGIYKYYPEQEMLEIINDYSRSHYVGKTLKLGEGIAGKIVQERRDYLIVENYYEWPGRIRTAPTDNDLFGAVLEVPLQWQGEVIGVLFIGDDVGRKFTSEDVRLLRLFADQAAISLVNAELIEKDAAKMRRLEQLSQATREITENLGTMTLKERLRLIARHVVEILNAEASGVLLKQPSGVLRLEEGYGHREGSFEAGKEYAIVSGPGLGLTSHIAYTGRPFREHGNVLQPHCHWASDGNPPDHLPSGPRYSLLAIPLKRQVGQQEQLVGLLRVENKKGADGKPHPTLGFTEEDEWILSIFAEAVVVAIESAELVKQLDAQKDHWARLVASSPNGIMSLDAHAHITGYNEKAQEILGYTQNEVIGKHADFLHFESNQSHEIGKQLHIHGSKITEYPTNLRSKSGEKIPIHLSATWLYDAQGERIGSVGYFEDLRAFQKMEKQRALLLRAINTVAQPANSSDGLQNLVEMIVSVLDHTFCRLLLTDGKGSSLRVEAAHAALYLGEKLAWEPRIKQHIPCSELPGGGGLPKNGTPMVLEWQQNRTTLAEYSHLLGLHQDMQSLLIIPLKIGNLLVGLLEVGELRCGERYIFTQEQIALVTAIATHSTVLIHNMQLFQEAEAARKRIHASFQASNMLLTSQSPDKVLDDIVEKARVAADATAVRIILHNEAGQHRIIAGAATEKDKDNPYPVRQDGISRRVMRTGDPEIFEDTDTEKDRLNPALLREGTRAFCCVPLTLQEKRIGAMSFYYDQPRHFPTFEVDALQLFANQAAAAFDGSQRMAKLESLRYAAEALAGVDGLSEVLQQIVQSAQDVLQADLAAVWPYDPEQQQFVVGGLVAHGALDGMRDHLQQEAPQWRRVADTVMTEQWIGLESVGDIRQAAYMEEIRKYRPELSAVQSFQGLVLAAGDEKLGVLLMYYHSPRHFSEEEKETARTFANHAVLALKKARLLDQVRNANRAAEVVARVTALGGRDVTLESIAQGTREAVGCDAVTLYVYDRTTNRSGHAIQDNSPHVMSVTYQEETVQLPHVIPGPIIHALLKCNEPFVIPNLTEDTPSEAGQYATVALPLQAAEEKIGVMLIGYHTPHRFPPTELASLNLFAHQAAVAIHNARLYTQARKRATALQTLYEAGQAVTGSLEEQEILKRIAEQAWRLPDARSEQIVIADTWLKEGMTAKLVAGYPKLAFETTRDKLSAGLDLGQQRSGRMGIIGRALTTGRVQRVVKDIDQDPDYIQCHMQVRSELAVPIKAGDEVIGVINIEHSDEYAFDEEAEKALHALAAQASIAIQNARAYEDLKRTKGIVAARTAMVWMHIASVTWGHEIQGHAATIQNWLHVLDSALAAGKPMETLKESLSAIKETVAHILDTESTEPLSTEAGVRSVFINDLIQERIKSLRSRQPSIQARWMLVSEASLTVRVNPDWLTRALDNLIDNAVDAMAESVLRELTVATQVSGNKVEIAFSDTGRGIPVAIRDQILKAPISKPKGTKGNGIGLLLAQTIVQAYGGDISVGSTGLEGTTMVVWLPCEGLTTTVRVPSGTKSVLLVSDRQEHGWSYVLREALSTLATLTVVDEEEVIEALVRKSYDMILIDATVVKDVLALIAHLRERRPDARLIVGATLLEWEMVRAVFRVGALDYIDKSESPEILRATLVRILEEQHDPFALPL